MKRMTEERKLAARARLVVVKIGSGVLTGPAGLNTAVIQGIADQVSQARASGRRFVIVSSGAVAAGFMKMGFDSRPQTVLEKQACAAIGQASLVLAWETAFAVGGGKTAQVLLTADDLANRRRYLNASNTLATLLKWNVIPIVNENDTVVVKEIKLGDNDTLAGQVSLLLGADLMVNLTDIDGLYDRDPRRDENARLIPLVRSVTRKIESMASATPGAIGAGGMHTKVRAARQAAQRGVPTIIASGKGERALLDILEGREVGTLFMPADHKIRSRKGWIAFSSKVKGSVSVDAGAVRALSQKGKSLLPSGLTGVSGRFGQGEAIEVLGPDGTQAAIGLTNYSAEELTKLLGCQTCDIASRLGYKTADEVIHRDNMAVGEDLRA